MKPQGIGSALPEPAAGLPEGLSPYKRTAEFTEETLPAGLRQAHSTKQGVWGLIRVIEGELAYRVVDCNRRPRETLLSSRVAGVIEPAIMHEVEPRGRVRFFVEFYR